MQIRCFNSLFFDLYTFNVTSKSMLYFKKLKLVKKTKMLHVGNMQKWNHYKYNQCGLQILRHERYHESTFPGNLLANVLTNETINNTGR